MRDIFQKFSTLIRKENIILDRCLNLASIFIGLISLNQTFLLVMLTGIAIGTFCGVLLGLSISKFFS